jgi:hypothetical protein
MHCVSAMATPCGPCEGARKVTLQFEPYNPSISGAAWFVVCERVHEMVITDDDLGGLNFWEHEHPIAEQFSSPKASLLIGLGKRTRDECAGALLRAHRAAVDDWIDFGRFVRPERWLTGSSKQIMVAGPQFLLEEYERELVRCGFVVRLKRHKRRLYWSGPGWSEQRSDLSVLHFSTSDVAAETFSAFQPDAS